MSDGTSPKIVAGGKIAQAEALLREAAELLEGEEREAVSKAAETLAELGIGIGFDPETGKLA